MINTRTIENFLSHAEISEIETMYNSGMTDVTVDHSNLNELETFRTDIVAKCYNFNLTSQQTARLNEILLPKLQKEFHKDVYIDNCHILESSVPYRVHTDATDENPESYPLKPGQGMQPAWTFIIPLADYDSSTIIFDQQSDIFKGVDMWFEKTNPPVLNSISNETYDKYLIDILPEKYLPYMSIHDIFPWRKGSLSATARTRFHSSDNFIRNGIKTKRALVMWTTIPKLNTDI